jgi:hypothetical protein
LAWLKETYLAPLEMTSCKVFYTTKQKGLSASLNSGRLQLVDRFGHARLQSRSIVGLALLDLLDQALHRSARDFALKLSTEVADQADLF